MFLFIVPYIMFHVFRFIGRDISMDYSGSGNRWVGTTEPPRRQYILLNIL